MDSRDRPSRRAARLRAAPVRGQRGPPRPHPADEPRPAHRHGRHPIEQVGRPEQARSVRSDGCDGHRGRAGSRPQPGRPGRRHRGDRRRDHHRRYPGADLLAAELRRAGLNARAASRAQSSRSKRSSASFRNRTRLAAERPLSRRRPRESAALGGRRQAVVNGLTRLPGSRPAESSRRLNAVDAAALAAAAAGRPVAVIRAVSDGGFGPGMVTGGMAALRSLRRPRRSPSGGPPPAGSGRCCWPGRGRSARGWSGRSRSSSARSSCAARRSTCASRSCTTPASSPTWSSAARSSSTSSTRCPTARRSCSPRTASRPRSAPTPPQRSLSVIDATCPLVSKVHAEARRFAEKGYTVALIGHAGHEEVEGTLGEAPDSTVPGADRRRREPRSRWRTRPRSPT